MRDIKDIRILFPEKLEEMLFFEETEEYIIVRPTRFLGSNNFARIARIIRDVGGEYISASSDSHFRIPKKKG